MPKNNLIVVEDAVYKVSDSQLKTLRELQKAEFSKEINSITLHNYIIANKHTYIFVGLIRFQTQL